MDADEEGRSTMHDEIDHEYDTFKALVRSFTPADAIKRLEQMGIDSDVVERIRERHQQETLRIEELEEPKSVVQGNRETWYVGPEKWDKCWPAIENILRRSGWPEEPAIRTLDESSTRIVSLLDHPKVKKFSTRGLVIGYVQSGKTTNFTSVMAKAADRDYKLFIVLAGVHNGLRRQTQARLEQQLVKPNPASWSQLTGLENDFQPQENPASYFGKNNRTHVLCVVKKNATVLRKLANWLAKASDYLVDCPALIIDDEADQATVATKSINPLIRKIIDQLPKSAYIGYTASPFANLLIDPSAADLYPKDFIVNLPKPVGHFGTEVLFGRNPLDGEDPEEVDDGHDMIRSIPEDEVPCVRPTSKADTENFEPVITDTLRDAVDYFWMATAARRVRGTGNIHNTMLIHTSVKTAVHNSFKRPLERLRERTAQLLADPGEMARMRDLWDLECKRVSAEEFGERKVTFDELKSELPSVLEDCRIVMDNYASEDRLDYENGPVVAIAVGGNTLSRGLTLEGLSVSYFVRAVSAYDTLLQMGRWFGFRNGYADLPRIWMTDELAGWFRDLATVESEMRRDVERYMTEDVTPLTFAVRMRTHPALRVTAAAKMRDAVTAASSYGGKRLQTHYFRTDAEWLCKNIEAARSLVAASEEVAVRKRNSPEHGRHLYLNVPHEHVIEFLREYNFHDKSPDIDPDLIIAYIQKRVLTAGSLGRWNIAIVGNPATDGDDDFNFTEEVAVGRVNRARLDSESPSQDVVDIKTLMSRRDAAVDLTDDAAKLPEKQIMEARQKELPDTGLLVLYPIDKISDASKTKKSRKPLNADEHVIGVGMVFPAPRNEDSTVEKYISADLSNVWIEDEDLSVLDGEDA
ncbi:Z1 domain-containing protein [Nocardiopsis halophila]|uniref:Z1 domain-containing protein n=1 Tax=Nocardiopsis halophila TaxID=141692 RepID=UPI00034D1AA0|nr:Z1 domain-containing protein [Nocardiopsis halophila]